MSNSPKLSIRFLIDAMRNFGCDRADRKAIYELMATSVNWDIGYTNALAMSCVQEVALMRDDCPVTNELSSWHDSLSDWYDGETEAERDAA